MAKVDFITLANIIFKDKDKYKFISDEEKENCFFVLNRKFAYKYLKQSQFFNSKNIDKPGALDIWYQLFYKTTKGVPQWWWKTKQETKIKPKFNNADLKMIRDYYDITNKDVDFLVNFFDEKLKDDIKRLKKFKS